MGANVWRDEQEWPLERAVQTSFYLHSQGRANTLDGNGTLNAAKPSAESRRSIHLRSVRIPCPPARAAATRGFPPISATSSAVPTSWCTRPRRLSAPIEVTGPIEATLWASTSATDTDFTAKLVDVFPDGTARVLTDGILRARYRQSKTTPSCSPLAKRSR